MARKFVVRVCVSGTIVFSVLLTLCTSVLAQSLDSAKALDERAMERYLAGNVSQARELAEQSLAIREKALGPDDPEVGVSLAFVAIFRMLEGRFTDAESYLSRALRITEKTYGADRSLPVRRVKTEPRNSVLIADTRTSLLCRWRPD